MFLFDRLSFANNIIQFFLVTLLGAWLTGNAWSAAGMCRVLASIAQSNYSNSMSSQSNDLVGWINEIITVALNSGDPLIHNYVNDTSK